MHTIGRLKRSTESKWDIETKGNNNILWHSGAYFRYSRAVYPTMCEII